MEKAEWFQLKNLFPKLLGSKDGGDI
ncbi:hypothetical protein CCACVL1_24547 [Corchorus capsularis]|uniref:Uncharacterized protein n=1 Tax=Corchorus capsularis TaxID=210143 RepID=A0A1R3GP60_COCAP|nr:hypothetical protein CCACVL1_24547 [Corchorus capsularis]